VATPPGQALDITYSLTNPGGAVHGQRRADQVLAASGPDTHVARTEAAHTGRHDTELQP
jgi:hypothetical protein